MESFNNFVEKLVSLLGGEEDYDWGTWIKIATLSAEHQGKRKMHNAKMSQTAREIEMLKSKIKALLAQAHADSDEWWNELHKSYGLPNNYNFHITDDNRIVMKPAKEKQNG